MIRVFIVIIVCIMSGCTTTDPNQKAPLSILTPQNIVKQSSQLAMQKRWSEAEALLREGAQKFPDELEIQEMLAKVRAEWRESNLRLEDWIVLHETEAMLAQRPYLKSLLKNNPEDNKVAARLSAHNASLNSNRPLLIACAENHQDIELRLARRCIKAASIINTSAKVRSLQATIEAKQLGKQAKQLARNKAQARATAITDARKHQENSEFLQVIELLEPLVIDSPDDPEITTLFQQAQQGRNEQIQQLISQGDSLYREERTKEALVLWKEAEQLDPDYDDLKTRITRAEKVLKQLQKIKKDN